MKDRLQRGDIPSPLHSNSIINTRDNNTPQCQLVGVDIL